MDLLIKKENKKKQKKKYRCLLTTENAHLSG